MLHRDLFAILKKMEYYVFAQNDKNEERLVASSPSLRLARKTARRISRTTLVDGVVGAVIYAGEKMQKIETFHRYRD